MTENTLEYLLGSPDRNFFLLAGPCVIEGEKMALDIAEHIVAITARLGIPYAFKGSYRKANRSRIDSFTGIGDEKALKILARVRSEFGIPVVTDIHETHEAAMAAEYVDILQIPAFLCRQTELLIAAARTGKMVNIKKGQFLAPEAMKFAVQKVRDAGNGQVAVTERGTTFGYGDLVVDFRGDAEGHGSSGDYGHHAQPPAAKSGLRCDRRPPRPYRDHGPGRHRLRSRRNFHRDTPRARISKERRSEHAATRPPRKPPRAPLPPPRHHCGFINKSSII